MTYLLFGMFLFWSVFIAAPKEGIVVACILFAIVCLKLIRLEIKGKN